MILLQQATWNDIANALCRQRSLNNITSLVELISLQLVKHELLGQNFLRKMRYQVDSFRFFNCVRQINGYFEIVCKHKRMKQFDCWLPFLSLKFMAIWWSIYCRKTVRNVANIRYFSHYKDDGKSEMLNDSRLLPTFTHYSFLQLMYMCLRSTDESFTEQLTDSSFYKYNCHDQHSCYLHRLYMDFSQPLQAELPWRWWDKIFKCVFSLIVWSLFISMTFRDFYVPRNLCI